MYYKKAKSIFSAQNRMDYIRSMWSLKPNEYVEVNFRFIGIKICSRENGIAMDNNQDVRWYCVWNAHLSSWTIVRG